MYLSKRKALTICKELWEWMRDNPESNKWDWPGWLEYGRMLADCPCCEYSNRHHGCYGGQGCLIQWPGGHCVKDKSPYKQWNDSSEFLEIQKHAAEIVQLVDEALAKLSKSRRKIEL